MWITKKITRAFRETFMVTGSDLSRRWKNDNFRVPINTLVYLKLLYTSVLFS